MAAAKTGQQISIPVTEATIHPTAIVSPRAELAADAVVGPYTIIEDAVHIGPGTNVGPHCVVHRYTRIGANNTIHPHAVIGGEPQDISYKGEETWIEIGDNNVIREGVTLHRSTETELPTRIGSHCFLMAYAHVGHGCQVGDEVILTNNVMLAGHVYLGDKSILGGGAAIHQFCRIGAMTMISGMAGVRKDILPYSMVIGEPARHYGLNKVGLRRSGVKGDRYRSLEQAFRAIRTRSSLETVENTPEVLHLKNWLAEKSKRGLTGFART